MMRASKASMHFQYMRLVLDESAVPRMTQLNARGEDRG